ncbi:MAG: hypothetical protein NTW03_06535 [Verrucomicrobia bacterium]|nr:hypothetical protein [Verrucomicrobiota bacterium]
MFVIPVQTPKPSKLELSWAPGPIANSVWTEAEKGQITAAAGVNMDQALAKFAPGWKMKNCGSEMDPGLRGEWAGRKNVLVTHPLDRNTGCVLSRTLEVPAGKKTALKVVVGHDPQGDFELIVRADGKEMLKKPVGAQTATAHWLSETLDLSAYAGKRVKMELVNQPTGWSYEAAYWAEIAVVSE